MTVGKSKLASCNSHLLLELKKEQEVSYCALALAAGSDALVHTVNIFFHSRTPQT